MSGHDSDKPDIRLQFRQAAKAACSPKADTKMDSHAPSDLLASGSTTKMDTQLSNKKGNTKSYAQVAGLVIPNPGALKRNGGATILGITKRRPSPLTIRLTDQQKKTIRAKAQAAGVSVNEYAKAVMLGSDYRPPLSKEACRQLLALGWELGRQGHNLNQIARHLNAGSKTPEQANNALAVIRDELGDAYRAVFDTLANGREYD